MFADASRNRVQLFLNGFICILKVYQLTRFLFQAGGIASMNLLLLNYGVDAVSKEGARP